jgi:hypothetical protein
MNAITCNHSTRTGGEKCGKDATHLRTLVSGKRQGRCAEHVPTVADALGAYLPVRVKGAALATKVTEETVTLSTGEVITTPKGMEPLRAGELAVIGEAPHPRRGGNFSGMMLQRQKVIISIARTRGITVADVKELIRQAQGTERTARDYSGLRSRLSL